MPAHAEQSQNCALADILQEMAPKSRVIAENTNVLREGKARRPDILIAASGRSPVIIEAEYDPARTVEQDAIQRLGARPEGQTRPVEAVVALRYPAELKTARSVKAQMSQARLQYCFFQEDAQGSKGSMERPTRFPETGWLEGTAEDLSDLIRMISIPEKEVAQAAEVLENSIEQAASVLDEDAKTRPELSKETARLLGMADVPQTRRMACAILANALTFHERIAGMHRGVQPLAVVCGLGALNPQADALQAWDEILKINYYPIFAVAKDILTRLPSDLAKSVLSALRYAAQGAHITNAHELTGRVFQRLISDRKYLATFYTRPHSAALLARLAVSKLRGVEWKFRESIERLRVADFACGTGALLSAVYDVIAAKHEREGGKTDDLHPVMMEKVLRGCDVMPSAAHIASATLSGARPDIDYGDSKIYTVPYGRQKDNTVKLGSLELLTRSSVMTLFNTTDPGRSTGRHGEETATRINVEMKDESFDLVIMNPPYTRKGTFAAFEASAEDQNEMWDRMNRFKGDTCYHRNAGIASAFAALGDMKLKPGGALALVLPLTAVSGQSWRKMRQMLTSNYIDIDILSVAARNTDDVSFSADTGMAECLIVARKKAPRRKFSTSSARFTSLRRRPQNFAHASEVAKRIESADNVRSLEDGPYGGAPVSIGGDREGEALLGPISADGGAWELSRIVDYSIAQTAYALTNSSLWLPGIHEPEEIATVSFKHIGSRGLTSRDITDPPPRGPFTKGPPSPTATYPALWSHNARNETRIICEPDAQLFVRPGMEKKAARAWATASRCHHNIDFRYNSQPLAVAFTEKKTMGGRAWPNVRFEDNRFDYAFAIWSNSFLGLFMHWWHASRQQPGRGIVTISAIDSLPTLDLRALSDGQLSLAESVFNRFRGREFMPAFLADIDPSRAALDRAVLCELLGFEEAVYAAVRELSAKWAAEPSVRGSKRRPSSPLAV